jgi:thioredoxin-like negative regulator of GroEL
VAVERTVSDLEARLPQMIEEAVTKRFHNMASRLQQEIEETHVRTLETFVKNIQVKLVQRVSALETDMARQADAMNQLREYSQRTEDNLSRLITGVDKLAQELPRRLQAPEFPQASVDVKTVRRKSSRSLKPLWMWLAIIVMAGAIFGVVRMMHRATVGVDVPAPASSSSAATGASAGAVAIAASTDAKTKMQAADQYAQRKDYATAEDIYKQILKTEPNNVDAMKALASVLYREDKIDESAAIVDKMPRN